MLIPRLKTAHSNFNIKEVIGTIYYNKNSIAPIEKSAKTKCVSFHVLIRM